MPELMIFLLLCVLVSIIAGIFVIRAAMREEIYFPATSDDWYIIFDVDSERKRVLLWFYPVIALRQRNGFTTAVTSCPNEVEAIVLRRGAEGRASEIPMPPSASATSGNWFRGGVMLDGGGVPSSPRCRDFSELMAIYRGLDFDIDFLTPMPLQFRRAIGAHSLPDQ